MPRVSVILPNFNYARYLKERVRSIVNQSFRDFEFLYLDDASTDASSKVMEDFAGDPRLKMRLFTENSGKVYQRWNDGAAEATGDWLWFAGADDVAHPRFLEKLLSLADAHPSVSIVHCAQLRMDDDGRLYTARHLESNAAHPILQHLSKDYFSAGADEVFMLTETNFLSCASAMLLRRDVFEAVGGWDSRLWLAADWDTYMSMLEKHDIAYTTERLSIYRHHRKTVSNTTKITVKLLEDAYCISRAYLWLQNDSRCAPEKREAVLQRIKVLLFELFSDPSAVIPDNLRFAAETVYQALPDKRLLKNSATRTG